MKTAIQLIEAAIQPDARFKAESVLVATMRSFERHAVGMNETDLKKLAKIMAGIFIGIAEAKSN